MNADALKDALRQANTLAGQGRFADAARAYANARALAPDDLQAILGLGHTLRMLGKPAEARAVFFDAVRLAPSLPDAHHGLALASHEMGDAASAESAYRALLRLQPASLAGAIGLGDVLNQQQRPEEALELLAPLQSTDKTAQAALEHTRGTARLLKEELEPALAHFDKALSLSPAYPKASHARAVTLDTMGRSEEALAAYRQAVKENPGDLGAHQGLNRLLFRLKRDGEFLRSYDEAERRMTGLPHFALARGDFLAQSNRADEALVAFDRALTMAPGHPVALQGKASALLKLGQAEAAIAHYTQALAKLPNHAALLTGLATACLVAREPKKAEDAARKALARDSTDQVALAALGSALRLQNDAREHDLNRYEDFVGALDLEPPAGFADMATFNGELSAWLDHEHVASQEHLEQSLRGGTQTMGNIFRRGHPLLAALRARIEEAVQRYIDALPRDAAHPFLGRRSNGFRIAGAWSARLSDGGFHTSHLHPGGWISSAYYVALPDCIGEQNQEGWLQFGAPSYDLGFAKPVRRAVQPKIGRLVLFPSYFWHGTVAFRAPQSRTTIAFDAVPTAASQAAT